LNVMLQNIGGFISASRLPNQVIIAFTQFITGWILLQLPLENLLDYRFIGLVLSTQMIAAGGYIINDYYDQKIDMINRPSRVIIGVKLTRRLALVSHLILNFTGIFIGFWIDPLIGLIHVFSSFLLWAYSNQLRRLPLIGNLTISTLSGLTFLIVSIFFRQQSTVVTIYALFAFTITLIREIIKDIEDVKGESAFGCQTIPVVWGIPGAKIAIYLVSLGAVGLLGIFLYSVQNLGLIFYFMFLGPFFLWFVYMIYKADTRNHFSMLHKACNLIILSGLFSIFILF
jgi:4-hydroxybenzoate polyprenyltransferase